MEEAVASKKFAPVKARQQTPLPPCRETSADSNDANEQELSDHVAEEKKSLRLVQSRESRASKVTLQRPEETAGTIGTRPLWPKPLRLANGSLNETHDTRYVIQGGGVSCH